ncbi:MAG: TrkH family potassium uptake protein, partial [Lachnospiraceae bacterium]|nr:TrkH family potassium uptake protein [Lachnospiraceae bacterium]
MNYKMMGRFIGHILLVEAVFMVPSLVISLVRQEHMARTGFAASIGITLALSLLLLMLCRGSKRGFKAKEGLVCVGFSWIMMSILGSLPFYISREIPSYIDALFETVSGFTTTGASVLPEVEVLSMSILYWRSFTHWLG